MPAPGERFFTLFARGVIRDEVVLASFRQALRSAINPATGTNYTEEDVRLATSEGSRYWHFADAIDQFGQSVQGRDLFLAQQLRPDLANTNFLRNWHAFFWGLTPLPASGGSGPANAKAAAGTIFSGSTTIGAVGAHTCRDPAGNIYQVLQTVLTPANGIAPLSLGGVTTGAGTNPEAGTQLTWVNGPLGADPGGTTNNFTVTTDFSGGIDAESDADLAKRVIDRIRYKPASGNSAQMRAWAQAASVAVESAYVYACAFHAGSVLVSFTQKRGVVTGPLARIPSAGTVAAVTAYVTPPGSPVVPSRWYVYLAPPVSKPSDAVLKLAMRRGSTGGWEDFEPWPKSTVTYPQCEITNLVSQTSFQVDTDAGSMPGGATLLSGDDAPALMAWNEAESEFVELDVTDVTDMGGGSFIVSLNSAPNFTMVNGTVISPHTLQKEEVAASVAAYFDALGPGEVIDLATDPRADRAHRFPEVNAQAQYNAGQSVNTFLLDALGAALSDVEMVSMSETSPGVPTDPSLGPFLITLGTLGVYDRE